MFERNRVCIRSCKIGRLAKHFCEKSGYALGWILIHVLFFSGGFLLDGRSGGADGKEPGKESRPPMLPPVMPPPVMPPPTMSMMHRHPYPASMGYFGGQVQPTPWSTPFAWGNAPWQPLPPPPSYEPINLAAKTPVHDKENLTPPNAPKRKRILGRRLRFSDENVLSSSKEQASSPNFPNDDSGLGEKPKPTLRAESPSEGDVFATQDYADNELATAFK